MAEQTIGARITEVLRLAADPPSAMSEDYGKLLGLIHSLSFDSKDPTPKQIEKMESLLESDSLFVVSQAANFFKFRKLVGSLDKLRAAYDRFLKKYEKKDGVRDWEEMINLKNAITILERELLEGRAAMRNAVQKAEGPAVASQGAYTPDTTGPKGKNGPKAKK